MKCPRCQKQLPPGGTTCPFCGFEINVESLVDRAFPETSDAEATHFLSSRAAGILILVIIIVAALAAYMVLK